MLFMLWTAQDWLHSHMLTNPPHICLLLYELDLLAAIVLLARSCDVSA